MYYLLEGFRKKEGDFVPTKTQAVTVQQLTGAITRMLREADRVQVTEISEEVFILFYQERSRTKPTHL